MNQEIEKEYPTNQTGEEVTLNETSDEQVIEVEYDKNLTEDYKKNYIMEEEGIGADEAEPYDIQSTFNTDSPEEMLDESTVIEYEES